MTETEQLLMNALEQQQSEHEITLKELERAIKTVQAHMEERISNAEQTARHCVDEFGKLQADIGALSRECAELRKLLQTSRGG